MHNARTADGEARGYSRIWGLLFGCNIVLLSLSFWVHNIVPSQVKPFLI